MSGSPPHIMDDRRNPRTAPSYAVPSRQLVSVEHPALVRNFDKAIETLQGDAGIKSILDPEKEDPQVNLALRPGDAMARPVQSTHVPSNNVLLKVTVPKRTGRKRKLGSDGPFQDAPESDAANPRRRTAKDLLRSLSDNSSQYQIEPVGSIEHTHVFRGMPDFVYSTTASSFANRFKDQILSYDFDKMKQFDIEMDKGALKNVDIIPPPSFSHGDVPFHYIYRQNPTVKKKVTQSGELETFNTSTASKVLTHLVSYDIPIVPQRARESLPPIESLDASMQQTIAAVQSLYEIHPVWTRRGIRNNLSSDEHRSNLRHAIPYIGYIFRSGPWRDAIVKLGLDPRTSPDYRHYQTFMFRLFSREAEVARDGAGGRRHNLPRPSEVRLDNSDSSAVSEGHIFTGKLPFSPDGRIWMVGDIKDPQLRAVLYPENPAPDFLRKECDIVTDGWFGNGTLAKAKTVMRAKIAVLMEGREPVDEDYSLVMTLPDHAYSEEDFPSFTLDLETSSSKEIALATEVRSAIRGAPMWRTLTAGKDKERKEKAKEEKEKEKKRKGKKKEEEKTVEFDQSEGEEEEIERREMIAEQVAAAAAARDADEANGEGEGDGDESERMDEDEDE
ncbi:unnamed protein product [Penicillium salamii]|uniref:Transcription factor IIIC, subunit 5 n=1 Tax=Penicillium salamii TaxID=1612424 RepID=A0A9W4JEE4_9EURO|nr:unnamed protein product [Penicillium salamii]CAG8137336.1 unnamed protein product [Penicillium salamii]CAG8252785.1 unnamed protein product [Penicillium salamii]CAG8304828.1 unnamed protein product [Penicillium salamii]CAG8340730.1 unnamed protein product [Penicillium salamii]